MSSHHPAGGQSGPGSKKRGAPVANARSDAFLQKRAKVHAARNIPTQPADAGLKDGELDLVAFVAAHEFEIRALGQSMATSKAVRSSRAFQQVPRGLRRRTASHNPKRVPRRLRARARKEMNEDNTPLVESRKRKPRTTRARIRAQAAKRLRILAARKRKTKQDKTDDNSQHDPKEAAKEVGVAGRTPKPKIRRNALNEPPKPPAKFRKRQINKTWLPTHRWHAKRARMTEPKEPLWRFAIPLTPNEKVYRPTHRAQGERGTMVWDMTYMSTIGLYGNFAGMARVLQRVGVTHESCWDDRGSKWRQGTRAWTGTMSRERAGIQRPMCQSTVVWDPAPQPQDVVQGLGEDETEQSRDEKKTQRRVFIRVHPSSFLELFNELLRLIKMENPRLYIEDLRFEIGSIELSGPASTETLLSVLTACPSGSSPRSKHADLFESLKGLTNPAALPNNSVLNFTVQDPRLRYPPRRMEFPENEQAQTELLTAIARWPAEENLQPSFLFDRQARHKASCLPSQKSINRRRSKVTSGALLKPTSLLDPPIPITLIASRSATGTQAQGTWTLLAPWKCILPLWYSIVHCPLVSGGNPRFAGLNETMQVAFERSLPWFPADFLGTDAGAGWELEQRQRRKRAWARRPKSKRVEWASLNLGAGRQGEIGDGHACDFEFLFGLAKPRRQQDKGDSNAPQDGDLGEAMDVDGENPAPIEKKDGYDDIPYLKLLSSIPKAAFNSLVSPTLTAQPLPPNAVACVRISLLSRGVVSPCARIYRLPSTPISIPPSSDAEVPASIPPEATGLPADLRSQWLSRIPPSCASSKPASSSQSRSQSQRTASRSDDMEARKRLLAQELLAAPPSLEGTPAPNEVDIGGRHPLVPNVEDLIGFVTTGSFCLANGRGAAIGSIAVEKVLPDVKANPKEGRLCIVRNAGENVGWIARWEVV
ncbi:ribonucleases P/MRP protein subunit POP1 domain-containing protein [Trichoderma chlorosporum]